MDKHRRPETPRDDVTDGLVMYEGEILGIFKRSLPPGVVEDMFQDFWKKVLEKREQKRADGSIKIWLIRIAERMVVNFYRKKGRKRIPRCDTGLNGIERWLTDNAPPVSERHEVWEALDALDPKERDAVQACVIEDHTYTAWGRQAGTSDRTAARRTAKGLDEMRERLEGNPQP